MAFWSLRRHAQPEKIRGDEITRRDDVRLATFGFVNVCCETGEFITEATIRDQSRKGAQIRLRISKDLPKRIIIECQVGNLSRKATVRTINGASIGVEFDEEIDVPRNRPSADARMRFVKSHVFGKTAE